MVMLFVNKRSVDHYMKHKDNIKVYGTLAGAELEIFQGKGCLEGLRHFYKNFVKSTRKKGLTGKYWEFFLLGTLKSTF